MLLFSISLLLLASNACLVIFTFKGTDVRKTVGAALGRLGEAYSGKLLSMEVKRYTRSITIKMNVAERIELFLIDKSNIRHYLPFINFNTLVLLMICIFVLIIKPLYNIFIFMPSAIVISLLFALAPLLILDLMARYNSENVRRRLAEFISILNRWCAVREDLFYAFEKCADSGVGEPLKTFIRDMVIQVKRGIEPTEALDMLQLKVDNLQFRDFIINVKQNIRHRGDILKLLNNLENQFYKIEEEYNRRRISTYRDRMLTYFVMFAVLFIAYFFIKLNPQVENFYLYTLQGKSLLTFFSILYAAGFYLSFGIMKFNH
ncbi:MAG: hypothetical protein FIA99_10425 [Ruminiclostridium sp.]|nr:hypothetical protein [Ruminiclostridium sp.]